MLSSQEEQAERRRVLANDQRVRQQTGTFMSHTHSELGGRYSAATPTPYVIGSTAVPIYPQASTPFQRDLVPIEPPLSFDNPALETSDVDHVEAQGDAADVPASPLSVERSAGPSVSQGSYRRLR
jgi:hypothetical protein